MRFQSTGLMVAVYQSLHTSEQCFRSSADRNLNTCTSVVHRLRGSLSFSSVSNFGTGRITYLGRWLLFLELDNISSIGTSTLLAIGSLVRISSSILTLPDTGPPPADDCSEAAFVSGMYSDCERETTMKVKRKSRQ